MKEILNSVSGFNPLQVKNNLEKWIESLNSGNINQLVSLYGDQSTFLPTKAGDLKKGKKGAEGYFQKFLLKKPTCELLQSKVERISDKIYLQTGFYKFSIFNNDIEEVINARFTFVWEEDEIIHHHSSEKP